MVEKLVSAVEGYDSVRLGSMNALSSSGLFGIELRYTGRRTEKYT